MMLKKIFYASLITLSFTMCSKRTEVKIIGEWKVVNVGQESFPADATWTFNDGGKLDIFHDINGLPTGTVSGEWESFARNAFVPHIEIKGLGPKGMDGKWRVEKLNKDFLVITRIEFGTGETAGAFLRREFQKK